MLSADGGSQVAFPGDYREIGPNERLVHTEVFEGMPHADEHPALESSRY